MDMRLLSFIICKCILKQWKLAAGSVGGSLSGWTFEVPVATILMYIVYLKLFSVTVGFSPYNITSNFRPASTVKYITQLPDIRLSSEWLFSHDQTGLKIFTASLGMNN